MRRLACMVAIGGLLAFGAAAQGAPKAAARGAPKSAAGGAPAKAAETPPAAAPPAAAPAADMPVLTVGLTRSVGMAVAERGRKGLENYLSRAMGGRVEVNIFADPKTLSDAAAGGGLDAAWLTPLLYVRAAEHGAIRPLLRLSRGGFTSYRSVIFVRSDSRAKTLDDLKGRSMVWVEKPSASGRLFPRAHLKKLGREPAQLFGVQMDVPDHKAVCIAVDEGLAEVGASISDERGPGETNIVDGCRSAGIYPNKFRVIEMTAAIPNDVVAVRKSLPAPVADKLRAALLDMPRSEDGQDQLRSIFQADGWADVVDADFAAVREAQALVAED